METSLLVPELMQRFVLRQRQTLRTVSIAAPAYLCRSVAREFEVLKMRIAEITNTRVCGYGRRGHIPERFTHKT